jgi:AbiV family abortive infection protein
MQTSSRKAEGTWHDVLAEERIALYDLHAAFMQIAVELKEEAELLLLNEDHPCALALARAAREELGKAQIVADRLDGCVSRTEFGQAFRRHDLKATSVGQQIELQLSPGVGQATLVGRGTMTYDRQNGQKLGDLRSNSMHDGWDGSRRLVPNETVPPEFAEQVVASLKSAIEHQLTMQYLRVHFAICGGTVREKTPRRAAGHSQSNE